MTPVEPDHAGGNSVPERTPAIDPPGGDTPPELRSEPLGGTALARAALTAAVPDPWYEPVPSGAGWDARVELLRRQFSAGAWLELLAPALDARGAAADALDAVAGGAGVVVTTGQQPGLFGGPLYTLTKAMSARALADALERATGVPVAPVFWAATDDTDFAEASVTHVVHDDAVRTLRLAPTAPDGVPMARVALGDDVERLANELRAAAGSAAHAALLDHALDRWRAGTTIGDAYVALLRGLLEPHGIAVLDASHGATRAAGFQLLRRALLRSGALADAAATRAAEIRAAGFEPQVTDVEGLSLVFRYAHDGRRLRVPLADARLLVPLVAEGELAPNVLLRPIVERGILPTAAYVAGPGEYAYFAQVSAVAAALGVPQPLAVPRWSGTVVEPGVHRALTRLGLDVADLRDPHAAETQLARAALGSDVHDALAALRTRTSGRLDALEAAVRADELDAARAVDGARAQLAHRFDRLERRLVAAAKRREASVLRDVARARASLYPRGVRQERLLNALPLLARYGPALLDAMRAAARPHADALVARGLAGVGIQH